MVLFSGKSNIFEISRISLRLRHPRAEQERSDVAETLGSMPSRQPKNTAAQNGACIRNCASYPSAMTGYT
ncbi:hypothetical protein, partial [Mesorhizobium sp. M0185]